MATTKKETDIMVQSGVVVPRTDHRKPSITPTSGFRPYTIRHFSGTKLLEYTMGQSHIQACVKNGTAIPTSRYLTLRAVSHRPNANAVITVISTKTGTKRIGQLGTN